MRLRRRERRGNASAGSGRRIMFPFIGSTVSRATLDATLRLARSQDATLVPAYLVVVPQHLSLDSPAPVRECEAALPVLELIDQLASRAGVPVDTRIERGRTHRHALSTLLKRERYDTVLPGDGFAASDLEWLAARGPRPPAAAV